MYSTTLQRWKLRRLASQALKFSKKYDFQISDDGLSKYIDAARIEAKEQCDSNIQEMTFDQQSVSETDRIISQQETLSEVLYFPKSLESKLVGETPKSEDWQSKSVNILMLLDRMADSDFIKNKPERLKLTNLSKSKTLISVRYQATTNSDQWKQYFIKSRNILLKVAETTKRKRPVKEKIILTAVGLITTAVVGWGIAQVSSFIKKDESKQEINKPNFEK